MTEWAFLDELAERWGVTQEHLQKVARAQNTPMPRGELPRFSAQCLASYPRFEKAPGSRRWAVRRITLDKFESSRVRSFHTATEEFSSPPKSPSHDLHERPRDERGGRRSPTREATAIAPISEVN